MIERGQTLSHHTQGGLSQSDTQHQPDKPPQDAAQDAFRQEKQHHLPPGHPQGAQQANLPAAAHHRQGY
ncbi:MAG TPA: hypothetical protein DCY27_02015 [Desulfobacterales bacterium]|nr:hypothetical protein [Desulfobacterales bacterium]